MQVLDINNFVKDHGFYKEPVINICGVGGEVRQVNGFYPYFFAQYEISMEEEIKNYLYYNEIKFEITEKFLPMYYQEKKTKVLKIWANDPKEIRKLRVDVKNMPGIYDIFEADILFKNRYMIDKGIFGMGYIDDNNRPTDADSNDSLRILAFDIEVLPPESLEMPNYNIDKVIVISMAFSHKVDNKDTMICILGNGQNYEDVYFFKSEKDLINYFIDVIREYDPDVISGYNIVGFDFEYLKNRMELNHIRAMIGRNKTSMFIRKGFNNDNMVSIFGRVIIDLLPLMRKNYNYPSYSLKTISHELLKNDKIDMPMWKMRQEYINGDYKNTIDYARKDAILVMELLNKTKFLDKYIAISKLSGLLLQDCINSGQSQKIEMLLMREFLKEDRLMAMKPFDSGEIDNDNEDPKYSGATVLDVRKGLSKDIVVLDYKSLYPTIMISQNYSYDTIIREQHKKLFKDEDIIKAVKGGWFVQPYIKFGIVPRILNNLLNERIKIKKAMKAESDKDKRDYLDARQYALKILLNSFYGYSGYTRARLFEVGIAEGVTSFGRQNILETKDFIEGLNNNYKVIYGDSITKDRFIPIKINNFINVINIEDLFNMCDDIQFDNDKEIGIIHNVKTLTRNGWENIKCVIRHKTNKKIYRVNQKYGESITTEDHSFITNNGNIRPLDMYNNNMIKVDIEDNMHIITNIDLFEYIKNYDYDGRHFYCDDNYIYISGNKKAANIWIKRFYNNDEIKELCILLAGYITNGSSTFGAKTGASICDSNVEWLNKMSNCYNNIFFNAKTCIIESSKKMRTLKNGTIYKDETRKLQMMNLISAHLFNALCGHGAKNKHMPSFIYNLDNKNQKEFLDVLIEGDGTKKFSDRYSKKYSNNNFWYSTISLELISNLSVLLNIMKIKYSISYREDKDEYVIKTAYVNNDIVKTKIQEELYDGYVYDISVENGHEFVDACGCILLHNTDSVFIEIKDSNYNYGEMPLDELKNIGVMIGRERSKALPAPMELLYEKIAKRIIFEAKKKYAYLHYEQNKKGEWESKIKASGIETKRKDWVKIVGNTLMKCIEDVLIYDNIDDAIKHTKESINKIENMEYNKIEDLDDIILTRKYTKAVENYKVIPIHIRIVKNMLERHEQLNLGDRVSYVIVEGDNKFNMRAESAERVIKDHLEIDRKYYIETQLLPAIDRFLKVVGIEKSKYYRGLNSSKKDKVVLKTNGKKEIQKNLFSYE